MNIVGLIAFDDPSVTELLVYNLGDGGAMSGILVAGRRSNQPGDVTYLWRHENFTNPNCLARFRYDMIK